jgi:cobalt-zinc-cadmium efflux system outer membrane protein
MKIGITLSVLVALASAGRAGAQNQTPLSALLAEAAKTNPDVLAAEHMWRAATNARPQVTTLPNPQFTVQEFSVGSPRPFAGFTNSNFAYIGIGASQELPYPGKLRLKGEVADREAGVRQAEIAEVRSSIADQTKGDYLRLAYLQQTLTLLDESKATLSQVTESELLRYRTGAGSQADILKAELQKTKLILEITMHHQDMATVQADLKRLVHRPQQSADIVTETITETPLQRSSAELLDLVKPRNPEVNLSAKAIDKGSAALQSAERGAKPDFSLGYMYQRTGPGFPAYYMVTFNVIPQRRKRVNAEVEQAAETLKAAGQEFDAQLQQQTAEVQKQYAAATSTAEQLTEYREGIIPQADAVFHSVLAGYESNKQQLDIVLTSLNEISELKREYSQVLLDHEMALARLETLTGVALR